MVRNQKLNTGKNREIEEFAISKAQEKIYKDEIFGQIGGKYTTSNPEKSQLIGKQNFLEEIRSEIAITATNENNAELNNIAPNTKIISHNEEGEISVNDVREGLFKTSREVGGFTKFGQIAFGQQSVNDSSKDSERPELKDRVFTQPEHA